MGFKDFVKKAGDGLVAGVKQKLKEGKELREAEKEAYLKESKKVAVEIGKAKAKKKLEEFKESQKPKEKAVVDDPFGVNKMFGDKKE